MAVSCFAKTINPGGHKRLDNVRKNNHVKTAVAYWANQRFSFDFIWFEVLNEGEDTAGVLTSFTNSAGTFNNTEQL